VLPPPEPVGRDDPARVGDPRRGEGVPADPLPGGEGQADHQEGADEFISEGSEVLAVADECGRDAHGQAGGEYRGDLLVQGG